MTIVEKSFLLAEHPLTAVQAPGKGMREGFPRKRCRQRGAGLRPGGKGGHSRQKEQHVLGRDRRPYLGTTINLSGPRIDWQRVAEPEQPPQGLERRGQPASLLLGPGLDPTHTSLPPPLLRAGPGRLDGRRLPFQVRLREAPQPSGAGRCANIKALRPSLIL